jgi:hypothetical protein
MTRSRRDRIDLLFPEWTGDHQENDIVQAFEDLRRAHTALLTAWLSLPGTILRGMHAQLVRLSEHR